MAFENGMGCSLVIKIFLECGKPWVWSQIEKKKGEKKRGKGKEERRKEGRYVGREEGRKKGREKNSSRRMRQEQPWLWSQAPLWLAVGKQSPQEAY